MSNLERLEDLKKQINDIETKKNILLREKQEIEEALYEPTLKEAIEYVRYRTIGGTKGPITVRHKGKPYVVDIAETDDGENCYIMCDGYDVDITAKECGVPISSIWNLGNGRIGIYFMKPTGASG